MVLEVIKERYSVRNFADKDIPDEVITEILEAGRLAPSWVNVQPWHFIVIKDKETKELLSQLSHGQPHVANAPVIIACCGNFNAWDKPNFKKILETKDGITEERVNALLNLPGFNPTLSGKESIMCRTIEELTYATAYMTLEAQNQGIGAVIVGWMGNDITKSVPEIYQQVKSRLNLPDHIILISLLVLGYPSPDAKKPTKIRKPIEEIISYEKF